MRSSRFALLLLLLIVGATSGVVAGLQWFGNRASGKPKPPVNQPPFQFVHALGRLEPESRIVNVAGPVGSRIETLSVREGDTVDKGDELATLDSHDEMLAAKELAAAELAEARRHLQIEIAAGQATIDEAKFEQQHSKEVLLLQIAAEEALVRQHQAELEEAQRDLQRANDLLGRDAISTSEYDDVALAKRSADESLTHHAKLVEQFKQDRELKLRICDARIELAVAQKDRRKVMTRVDSLAAALAVANTRFEKTTIRAPLHGQILEILTRPGESMTGDPILRMGNTESMFTVAEVYETDVRRVRVGQHATIASRAFPHELTGRVVAVGSLVQRNDLLSIDPTADVDARVVEVRIALEESAIAARYNQHQVQVRIQVSDGDMSERDEP